MKGLAFVLVGLSRFLFVFDVIGKKETVNMDGKGLSKKVICT